MTFKALFENWQGMESLKYFVKYAKAIAQSW